MNYVISMCIEQLIVNKVHLSGNLEIFPTVEFLQIGP